MTRIRRLFLALLALALMCPASFAIDDEPNELNWTTLGSALTSFKHFYYYAKEHEDFRAKLLACKPNNELGRSSAVPKNIAAVWINGADFPAINGWGVETIADRAVASYPSGHGGGATRVVVTIPKSGYYRLWTEYYHDQGSTASFYARVEDAKVADLTGPNQAVVQDVFSWKFDFAEMGRVNDPLPNRRDEPTGFLWESTPMIWLEKGARTVTIAGMIHDGPFAPRRIASVVLTEEPIAVPTPPTKALQSPSKQARSLAKLWELRPVVGETNPELLALWKEWRDALFADLADYKLEGVEGRRMAALTAFDPDSNLIGTPRQIRDEKIRFQEFLDSFPKDAFIKKIEGEDFNVVDGWWKEGNADASGGQVLIASYGDGLVEAEYTLDVPKAGAYSFWSRVLDLPGYLAEYHLTIEGADGQKTETTFCADEEENKKSPGLKWVETKAELPAGEVKLTLWKEYGPGLTYRRYDCLIVTNAANFSPEGQGEIVPTSDVNDLTFWTSDPWAGFTRLSAPKSGETIDKPLDVELPYGAQKSYSLLIRNEGDEPQTIEPEIVDDAANLLSCRLQAFTLSPQFGWAPHPLLERKSITIPPQQTVGLWLTFNGDVESKDEKIALKLGEKTVEFNVTRKVDLRSAPVPYVGGWSAPYEQVSCWETFKRLGLNVINDLIVPSDVAKKYGIKLFVRLNDGDVSPEHVAQVEKSFKDYGYSHDDWAWSFMDEPGASMSDAWVELAKKFKEAAPGVRVWCNPGELWGAPADSDLKMLPYVDCYCPYADHFWQNGGGNETYQKELHGEGRQYAIRLTYTTPCFGEKALGAPGDMFGPMQTSVQNNLDGWMFYALLGRYEYCNSPWDEMNAYVGDQSVYLYQGAEFRTISTRTGEAIREAVDTWRAERLKEKNDIETP
ncbi:MAG: hypothetical protein IK077_02095 [Thermoguttaceae bacterium]|nr:hypothetical protein [Thermoguttaceae bacterium]